MLSLKKTSMILVLLTAIFSQLACDNSKARQVAKAEDDFSQGLKSIANVIADAKSSGVLSQADIDYLKPILTTIAESNLQAIEIAKTMDAQGNLPQDSQQKLIQVINFVSDQLVILNNEGGLRIKNKDKALLFNSVVLAMQSATTALVVILSLKKGN